MGWSALFDHTHIVKGVPVDAEIELQCRICISGYLSWYNKLLTHSSKLYQLCFNILDFQFNHYPAVVAWTPFFRTI